MSNSIALSQKYLPYLDEVFKLESRTAVLDTAPEFVRETTDAKTVLVAKVTTQGLVNYSRNEGFTAGDVSLVWETHTFSFDRGRQFMIDEFDSLETLGTAFAAAAGTFLRTRVVPEVDAIRFANYHAGAGTRVTGTLDASGVDAAIVDGEVALAEAEVPTEGTILFVSPTVYGLVKKSASWSRPLVPSANPNRNFGAYDDMEVIQVPKSRFLTNITLGTSGDGGYSSANAISESFTGDGSTKKFTLTATAKPKYVQSVTIGGTAKTEGTDYTYDSATGAVEFASAPANDAAIVVKFGEGKEINFLIVNPAAVIQIAKQDSLRAFSPEENQKGRGWLIDYRVYHDAWVLENRACGIYAHAKA